ncbi:MAG: DUF2490 domain-containing protein [Cytophagales bacterium]|nr:MAG: DUF2490 domain-containing protein [Cytophagales bacterium]
MIVRLFKRILLVTFLCFGIMLSNSVAQNTRKSTFNNIGWYNFFGTFNINKKWSILTEYQFRRTHLITTWQQSLLRLGINYQLYPNVQLRVGYAWIETFPYGEIPINGMGKQFTEHRIFEALTLTNKTGIFDITHRFILEQRFVGKYTSSILNNEDKFPLWHRMRYMLKIQVPLKKDLSSGHFPYIAFYDEVLIGFGKNVNENIFDQNRVGVLLGYKFNNNLKLEIGYLNQTLQLGRRVNNQIVFQYNNGLIINTLLNIDFSKH